MKLLVLDGNSIVNRAFYGIKTLSTKDGKFTNGIFGFLNILFSLKETYKPEGVAIAFDVHAPTFRHEMYREYKGNRKGMPEELAQQMPVLKDLLKALGYKLLECPGWEADDIIGTLAHSCNDGDFCYIATGDRDSLQLVNEKTNVLLAAPKGGKTETVVYDIEKIIEDKGVEPLKLIEVKALMGDASDNIPGVQGIGEKTATDLIKKYGSIDYIYEHFDELEFTPSVRTKLSAGKEMAFISRTLGTISKDAPVETDYNLYVPGKMDEQAAKTILTELEMQKFIDKLGLRDTVIVNSVASSVKIEYVESDSDVIIKKVKKSQELYFLFNEDFTVAYVNSGNQVSDVQFSDIICLLEDEKIRKYTFDCKGLYSHCIKNNINVRNIAFDILLAGYLLNPNSSEYSVSVLSESYRIAVDIDTDNSSVRDCAVMRELCKKLDENIIENSEEKLLHDIEIPLSEVLSAMEIDGFKVDFSGIHEYGINLEAKLNELISTIYNYSGEEFNLNSPKQLGVVLFEKLGLPVKKKTKTGYSTNAEVLESLYDEHPIIPAILEYRTIQKLKSTYCDGLLKVVGVDGRIHSTFQQTETRTGRLSSTEPNLQNIPVRQELGRELRKFFISNEGNVLIDADYSQIELRVLADLADDANMIEAFNNDDDIHAITASQVFNMPLSMVTPLMRSRAKAVNFGIVYGIGAFSLSKDIKVSVYEAKKYIENYLNHYSGVNKYMENVVIDAKNNGYVKTLFNRRRYLPELSASNAIQRSFGERVARNMPIQGTAADIIKIAMVKVFNRLRNENMKSRLIMQVHDELIIEVPENESEKAMQILKEEMENAVKMKVRLSVDAHIGKTWYDAKG
ncbi:MAG: DNA polymerase I [Clostridia bacterium]|nr:DNA polymerase I [Clostridia bacterium]